MARLRGLFILDRPIYDLVYGQELETIAHHVELLAPPQDHSTIAQNPRLLTDVQVLFGGWGGPRFDEPFFQRAPHLRAIFHAGGAPVLPPIARQRGVVITSAHLANSIPVAEYTLATILFSLKHGWHLMRQTRQQRTFVERNGAPGCYGSTVGIISLGAIGRLLLELLEPFDLHVLVYDPFLSPEEAEQLGVGRVSSLAELFQRCDVVSLHAPHLRETEGMVTGQHLASMKPGSTFINTARGALVRQGELIEVARTRADLQFVLDVTDPIEPPEFDSPLYTLPNVVLTPHIAGSAGGELRRMGRYLAEELERYVAGQPLKWAVPAQPTTKRLLPRPLLRSLRRGRSCKTNGAAHAGHISSIAHTSSSQVRQVEAVTSAVRS